MIRRDINSINQLCSEISYIDEFTEQKITGIVSAIEYMPNNVAFVYVTSPYKEENTKTEYVNGKLISYKDIIVFDDKPTTINNWHRDSIMGQYGKYVGSKD